MVKKAKIIFLGDSGVGKSCVISCITGNPISTTHEVKSYSSSLRSEWTFSENNRKVRRALIDYRSGTQQGKRDLGAFCLHT